MQTDILFFPIFVCILKKNDYLCIVIINQLTIMLMKTYRTFSLTLDCNASDSHLYCDITPYSSYKNSVYLYSLEQSVKVPVELLDSVFNSKVRTHHLDSSISFSGELIDATVCRRGFFPSLLSSAEFLPCYSLSVNGSEVYLVAVPEFLLLPHTATFYCNPLKRLFFASLSPYDLFGDDCYDKSYYLLSLKPDSVSSQLDFDFSIPSMNVNISPHFRLAEFLSSSYEDAVTLFESLTPEIVDNITSLCGVLLEPLREYVGVPVSISSGFRTSSLNSKVKGSPKSLHMQGRAADIYISYKYSHLASLDSVYSFLSKLPFTELKKYETFIHVAL